MIVFRWTGLAKQLRYEHDIVQSDLEIDPCNYLHLKSQNEAICISTLNIAISKPIKSSSNK